MKNTYLSELVKYVRKTSISLDAFPSTDDHKCTPSVPGGGSSEVMMGALHGFSSMLTGSYVL